MNKKVSRLLSMVLAMVMTFSCVVFSNVSAMAATKTDVWIYNTNGTTVPATLGLDVSSGVNSAGYSNSAASTIPDLTFSNGSNSINGVTCLQFASGKTLTITPTVNGDVKFYAVANNNSNKTINFNGSSTTLQGRKSTAVTALTITGAQAGTTYNITTEYDTFVYGASITYEEGDAPTTYSGTVTVTNNSATAAIVTVNNVSQEAAPGESTLTFTDLADGTYPITVDNSHELSSSASLVISGSNGTAYIIINDKSTEDSSSETTTEEITETTTTAPVGGNVYEHNFGTDGKVSTFYTITGNLATGRGEVTYNGLTISQCLKMESSTNISFTASKSGTLTLVFGGTTAAAGKRVKIDGTVYTADSNGIVTADLLPGAHAVTKSDSINLFYMSYTEEGSTEDSTETTTEATTETTTVTTTETTTEATTYALNLNVITGEGAAAGTDVKFTVNGSSITAKTGEATNIAGIKPGETYTITFTSAVSKYIYNWSNSLEPTAYNSKAYTLTYTAPADLAGDVTLDLTYATGKIFVTGQNAEPKAMGYGTYGIGDYKHSITTYAAEDYIAYNTLQYSLYDIASGNYNVTGDASTNNIPDERLLISADAGEYIKFKVSSGNDTTTKTLIYLDVSGGVAKVSVDASATGNENAGIYTTSAQDTKLTELSDLRSQSGMKAMFYVTDGTYIINGADASKVSVVKSLRLFQIDNKTGTASNDIVENSKAVEIYADALAGETVTETTLFARIIGEVDAKGKDDFEQIDKVGFTFVNADEVDAWEAASGHIYNPNINYSAGEVSAPTHVLDMETTTVYDAVYDIASYDASAVKNDRYTGNAAPQAGISADKTYFEVLVYGSSDMRVYAYAYTDYAGSGIKTYLDGNGNPSVQLIEITNGSINVSAKQ